MQGQCCTRTNHLNGSFTINVQGIFNCLFFSTTFVWLPIWVEKLKGVQLEPGEFLSLVAGASFLCFPWAAMLGSTLVVSSYADPIYCVCFVHIFMSFVILGNFDIKNKYGRRHVLLFSCVLLGPVAIKESAIYLIVIFLLATFIIPLSQGNFAISRGSLKKLSGHGLAMVLQPYLHCWLETCGFFTLLLTK